MMIRINIRQIEVYKESIPLYKFYIVFKQISIHCLYLSNFATVFSTIYFLFDSLTAMIYLSLYG